MVAAQRFNHQESNPSHTIYGCVTTGSVWRFLQFPETQIWIDDKQDFIDD